jgi:hypothetical protein
VIGAKQRFSNVAYLLNLLLNNQLENKHLVKLFHN